MFHPSILEKKRKSTEISDSASYSTPKDVKNTVIRKAIDCLLQVNEKQTNKNALFSEEATVLLQMVCVKVPECPDRIVRFKLPHLLVTPQTEVCLIVADKKKGKRFDHEPQIERWKDLLEEKGITEVKTVLPMRQLKVEFDQYELKRRLKTLHDTFLVDAKISGHVSHILGKIFKSKNLIPTPVRLEDDQKNLKEIIQGALHKSSLRIHNAMITATLRVGHMSMKPKEIRENIKAVIEQLDEVYPGGADNVRSLHIKTATSIAVPVYLTLKPSTTVTDPHIEPKRPKLYKTVEDELSTVPGARVRVTPEGDVSVIRDLNEEESEDEGSEDEVDDKENSNRGKKSKKGKKRNNYITPLSDTSIANLESDSDNSENGHDVDNGVDSDDGGEEEEEEGSGGDQSDDNDDE